ncbi:MAG: potassium transporter Kup [Variibacter sp.]|nr:potassium transporter Kup [Variibacter sp.]
MSQPSSPQAAGTAPVTSSTSDFWKLTLGSIGVVYGDIGTSPLYALKESLLAASQGGAVTPEAVFGVVSLIIWALVVIVTIKYVVFLLRADNHGEGGTLTLMALALRGFAGAAVLVPILGMVGAALFYGDAVLTPAISVLSAVEGLKVITPAFDGYIVPLSLVILVLLFTAQRFGTQKVASLFGPVTLVWFVAMAVGGMVHILEQPRILAAINPLDGLRFLFTHGHIGFLTLGAVFLAVTGAEALYADLGHFGRRPIQFAWIVVVFPALAINYLGQGALLLSAPGKIENPFFLLYPSWAVLPMVVLATAATVIASQAVITGAFSLTRQAVQLGLLPRFEIRRTSETQTGQIYVPRINWIVLTLVVITIGVFKTSGALAGAYGVAVSGTMVATVIMAFVVVWKCWRWPLWAALALILPLLAIDVGFLSANLLKVFEGGWLPLAVGGALLVVMLTWRRGSKVLADKTRRDDVPLAQLISSIERRPPELRVQGTAVFLTAVPETAPTALLHNLKHNKVLHERNVVLSVVAADVPFIDPKERVSIMPLSETFSQVTLRFGFMETPNVPGALPACRDSGWKFDVMQTSFFLSRRTLKVAAESPMPAWQDALFVALAGFSDDAARYFNLPTNRVVEIGTQVAV